METDVLRMMLRGKALLCRAIPPIFSHWRVLQCTPRERRRISSRAIIFYSAFADTGFTTENNWPPVAPVPRGEIKKEHEKRL